MLFHSIDFAVFLPIVFFVYWALKKFGLKIQNIFIVCASYVFYGWWDWRFLSLIIFSTIVDYMVGIRLDGEEDSRKRKALLIFSIVVNLSLLGFFKYFNFFLENFSSAFSFFGGEVNIRTLNIILPAGISFYTFQTLSYSIDVYNRRLKPTRDLFVFSAYVTFFPQLVAGPIERATHLLPQFQSERRFEYSKGVDGLRQILWGLFKKVVIADNCGKYANLIFDNASEYSGSALLLGAFFFAFQIYGDFSGYSDIAIGTSRLFGFDLMQNFASPYFSRDMAEFWRRWHISLSTWFRDYLYIPLGGSRGSILTKIRNTFLVFIISGFWHGASWTFIIWGALNAIYFLPLLILNKNRNNLEIVAKGNLLPSPKELLQILITFSLTVFAWIFFRAESLNHAISYVSGIFSPSIFSIPNIDNKSGVAFNILMIGLFLIIEWLGREDQYALERTLTGSILLFRWGFYSFITILILANSGQEQKFIYFQF